MKDVVQSVKLIINRPLYLLIALVSAWLVIASVSILPNLELLRGVLKSSYLTIGKKVVFLFDLSFNIFNNQSGFGNLFLPLVAIFFGLTLALLTHYAKRQVKIGREAGLSALGIVAGIVGVGCSACGSVAIASLLGVGATAQFTGKLPFKGLEFSLLSLLFLGISFVFLAKKVNQPPVCSPRR